MFLPFFLAALNSTINKALQEEIHVPRGSNNEIELNSFRTFEDLFRISQQNPLKQAAFRISSVQIGDINSDDYFVMTAKIGQNNDYFGYNINFLLHLTEQEKRKLLMTFIQPKQPSDSLRVRVDCFGNSQEVVIKRIDATPNPKVLLLDTMHFRDVRIAKGILKLVLMKLMDSYIFLPKNVELRLLIDSYFEEVKMVIDDLSFNKGGSYCSCQLSSLSTGARFNETERAVNRVKNQKRELMVYIQLVESTCDERPGKIFVLDSENDIAMRIANDARNQIRNGDIDIVLELEENVTKAVKELIKNEFPASSVYQFSVPFLPGNATVADIQDELLKFDWAGLVLQFAESAERVFNSTNISEEGTENGDLGERENDEK